MASETLGRIDEEVRRAFERSWREGRPRPIDEMLTELHDPSLRLATLFELVLIEMEFSWRRGGGTAPSVTAYLSRFPELNNPSVLPRLQEEETDLRRRWGGTPETTQVSEQAPLPPENPFGVRIPGYEILGELGRGGMGVVYRARQVGLNRTVALKMIRAGALADGEDLRRFRTEAEAAARLRHPNVVQIYEVGEVAGRPYLALEFVAGGSLDRRLAGNPMAAHEAARLVTIVARAVHAAHQVGIIHRDLKPANILLEGAGEGVAEVTGFTPKLTDFGLAKRLEPGTGETQSGAILGTPSYMPPEQAAGKVHAIGPTADVYSLGAVLYELLTGRPPFRAPTTFDTLLQVIHQEPVPVRRLQPRVPVDLETICLKCLEKDSRRRYSSAEQLAEDLDRFTRGEPVKARPVSLVTRALKWARRNPAWAGFLAVTLLFLATLIGWGAIYNAQISKALADTREAQERTEAALKAEQQQRMRAETNAYYHAISRADREWWANNVDLATRLLDECQPDLRGWEWGYLRRRCSSELLTLPARAPMALRADGRWIAATDFLGGRGKPAEFAIFDTASGTVQARFRGHPAGGITALAISSDGKWLASGEGIGYDTAGKPVPGEVQIWDIATGQSAARFPLGGTVVHLTFQEEGNEFAAAIRGTFPMGARSELLIGTPTGKLIQRTQHAQEIFGVAYTAQGLLVARSPNNYAAMDSPVTISDGRTGTVLNTLPHTEPVWQVAFSPRGDRVGIGANKAGYIWDRTTGKLLATLSGHSGVLACLAFSADGKQLASGTGNSRAGEVVVWDTATGQQVRFIRGPQGVMHVAFTADGKRLATANPSSVKVWDITTGQVGRALPIEAGGGFLPRFSPDGRRIAYIHGKGEIRLWDIAEEKLVRSLPGHANGVSSLAFHPGGKKLASGGGIDRTVKLWDLETGEERVLSGHWIQVTQVAFSPDGNLLASVSWDHTVRLWNTESGESVRVLKGHKQDLACVAFSPDGKHLVSGGAAPGQAGEVFIWEAATGEKVGELKGNTNIVSGLAFSPDGKWVATAGADRQVRLWAFPHRGETPRALLHPAGVSALAFTPDGMRIVTVAGDGNGRVWDAGSGLELLSFRGNRSGIAGLSLHPLGTSLIASGDGTVLLFQGRPAEAINPPR